MTNDPTVTDYETEAECPHCGGDGQVTSHGDDEPCSLCEVFIWDAVPGHVVDCPECDGYGMVTVWDVDPAPLRARITALEALLLEAYEDPHANYLIGWHGRAGAALGRTDG